MKSGSSASIESVTIQNETDDIELKLPVIQSLTTANEMVIETNNNLNGDLDQFKQIASSSDEQLTIIEAKSDSDKDKVDSKESSESLKSNSDSSSIEMLIMRI